MYNKGQRWMSESEPELGLGTVMEVEQGRVRLLFPAAGEARQYAVGNAPLKRVRFKEGDNVRTYDDETFLVKAVIEEEGSLTYVGEKRKIREAELNDHISLRGAEERLFSGQIDDSEDFDLRVRTLQNQHFRRKSPVRGFIGGRIDLIPHQLYIAHEVSSRQAPRVLLSDEVGLGKTIEACLILHRLLLTGRASRVLVLVPESLIHQWFIEMMRRFNIWLRIFDEERCASLDASQENPFRDDQLILASINFLAGSPGRAAQAIDAGWDVVAVDEAHHLEWTPAQVSPEYALVQALSEKTQGLLLLTATPEQLGEESHFARLRLLDPDRFSDFEKFQTEASKYRSIAQLAERLPGDHPLTDADFSLLAKAFKEDRARVAEVTARIKAGDLAARRLLLDDLLDLHGPGRVLFRNTRAAMSGFPKRVVHLSPLEPQSTRLDCIDTVSTEFAVDAGDSNLNSALDLKDDPRVEWLVGLLRQLDPAKVLVICRSKEKALAVEAAVRARININATVFHEGLSLVERDRNAAYFAEDDGARLLIRSEIGSEGRNFQFAHHLAFLDLPLNPEVLEQRIGRLDRIGQKQDIQIHVAYLRGSPQEVLTRWHHEGLDAFETSLEGGNELFKQFGRHVHDLALEFPALEPGDAASQLDALLKETKRIRKNLRHRLEEGRDRLLEMNSFRPHVARGIIEAIRQQDQDAKLEEYMLDVFERFGVHFEEMAPRTYYLNAQGIITDALPGIPGGGLTATFDRSRAVSREDVAWLTWDHPMVTGAIDLVLDSGKGNSSFAVLPDPTDRSLLIETLFVLDTVAERRLHVDRFLPATPLRLIINHKGEDLTDKLPSMMELKKGNPFKLLDNPALAQKMLPGMIRRARKTAELSGVKLIQESLTAMNGVLDHEISRLKTLQKVNSHIRPEEISLAEEQRNQLAKAIESAAVRLDSIRLIWKGPPEMAA